MSSLAGICSLELISWWERGERPSKKAKNKTVSDVDGCRKDVQWGNMLAIDLDREMFELSEKSSLRCI